MKSKSVLSITAIGLFLALGAFWIEGCSSLSPAQQKTVSAIVGSAESLANVAIPVAATIYGSPAAGAAAQAALYAIENQANPLVGVGTINDIQNPTGTAALNTAILNSGLVKPRNKFTVADVETIDAAAQIAPALASALSKPTAQREPDLKRIARYLTRRTGQQVVWWQLAPR